MNNNRRLVLSIFWVVLGLVLVVLSIMEVLDSSVYAGMGGALAAVGALQVIRNLRYRACALRVGISRARMNGILCIVGHILKNLTI